jgi:hypothetical protein
MKLFLEILILLIPLKTSAFFVKNNNLIKNRIFDSNYEYESKFDMEITSEDKYYRYSYFPTLTGPNKNGSLTWYNVGQPKDFYTYRPKKVTIRDINYAVWKDKKNNYYALRDGYNTAPYNGNNFIGSGPFNDMPYYDMNFMPISEINSYKIVEKNGFVYLNTVYCKNETDKDAINSGEIWIEPEAFNNSFKEITIQKDFFHNAKYVSMNSLDICHLNYMNMFGNDNNNNNISVEKIDDHEHHYRVKYNYQVEENSIAKKLYKNNKIEVENEFILPHTTVARIKFGKFMTTIITNAHPISKFHTRLYIKAYRNYWYANPFENIILNKYIKLKMNNNFYVHMFNEFGNKITYELMEKTIGKDNLPLNNIKYDNISSLYKSLYKKYYEFSEDEI